MSQLSCALEPDIKSEFVHRGYEIFIMNDGQSRSNGSSVQMNTVRAVMRFSAFGGQQKYNACAAAYGDSNTTNAYCRVAQHTPPCMQSGQRTADSGHRV
jgi:hypothetical protein